MAGRVTIDDIARRAEVSVATVDRVLNGRHPVREETARRVYAAAQELGYHAAGLIRQRLAADLRGFTFGFLLQRGEQDFYQALAAALQAAAEAAPGVRGRAIVEFVPEQTPERVVAALQSLGRRCDAIAMTAIDHHHVTKAVEDLKARNIPVIALLSDVAQGVREAYVGLNNVKVGRTAAWLISKMARKPGKVAVFIGGHRWHGHELRETGFRSFFRQAAPQFTVLDTLVNLDTYPVTYEATLNLLERNPDLAGFYVAGGGMEGAIGALREVARQEAPPLVIVNELTPESRAALQDGHVCAVVATPLEPLARSTISKLAEAAMRGAAATPGQVFLPFDLVTPEAL